MNKRNSHDSMYKKFFSNHRMVMQLLTGFVNDDWIKNIEFSTLERIDKSFVTDEFHGRESDMIYRVRLREDELYVFILLEFQSTVDRFMSLRMMRYIAELYEYLVKNYMLKKLPAVFPVMLYNGEKRWTAPQELNNLIEKTVPDAYIPRFRYYKIAENEFSREFLKRMNNATAALFYAENCKTGELIDEIETIAGILKNERPEEVRLFINWFRHVFKDNRELTEDIKDEHEVKTMLRSSVEKLADNARLEGKKAGRLEGKLETAKALLREKMTPEKVAKVTGLPVEKIKKLKGQ